MHSLLCTIYLLREGMMLVATVVRKPCFMHTLYAAGTIRGQPHNFINGLRNFYDTFHLGCLHRSQFSAVTFLEEKKPQIIIEFKKITIFKYLKVG